MTPFLRQTAASYYARGLMEDTCFIFPNRRSELFFMKHLSGIISEEDRQGKSPAPMLVPWMCTINDFIYRIYGVSPTPRVTLLLELYKVYSELFDRGEPLDEFIFWGDIIINDFNDVDKYLADASRLFANISDLKSIQDSYSYLSERQRRAIEAFVSHFSDRDGKLTVDIESDNPKVKERFLQIWNILYPMYLAYRKALSGKGMAYDGMVYRGVAERFAGQSPEEILSHVFPYARRFVFVGLNALNECEKTVMRRMRDASLAEFCWDYSGEMIKDRANRSSFFMEENLREFPQSAVLDSEVPPVPHIRVISVPSATGQAKILPHIFREIAAEYTSGDLSRVGVLGGGAGNADCAVVLPDESLLMTVLDTIPPEIRDINVTMGYPVASSAFCQYMNLVIDVQMNIRKKGGCDYFYHKPARTLFSDGIFRLAAGEAGLAAAADVITASRLFIPAGDLDAGGLMSVIFRPVIGDRTAADAGMISAFARYLLDVIEATVPALKKSASEAVEVEFAMEFHKTISSLSRMGLDVKPQTFVRLLKQIMSPVSVPFKGEPLQGLQIMGPLETRALDFDNIVILSANEGTFPRRNVSSSFIPPELRRGFGLPAYEYQDAVWAYYFYRMISRASNVWLLYDSRTEGLKSGEESRYIKQLQYHFNVPMERQVVMAALSGPGEAADIPKTAADVDLIKGMTFSASSLQEYLSCQARFYYHYVKGLTKADEVVEVMDAGLFGTVFHELMQALYLGEEAMASDLPAKEWAALPREGARLKNVSREYLRSWLKREDRIRDKVRQVIMREMHAIDISGRNLVITDVIVRYVMKTLSVDLDILEKAGRDSFRIEGLEKNFLIGFHGFRIKGFIDRIDTVDGHDIRVVDYKTGEVKDADVDIPPSKILETTDAVFGDDNRKRPKIALQLYIYDKYMLQSRADDSCRITNCIYSTRDLFVKNPECCPVVDGFMEAMDERLERLFGQMTDPAIPFRMTDDIRICSYCDYKTICGR